MATKLMTVVCRVLLVTAALISLSASVQAETPWRRISLFKKVESDPNQTYMLSDQNGPWMIMAYTFSIWVEEPTSKDSAKQAAAKNEEWETEYGKTMAKANQLVQELRSQHGMFAYVHPMDFNFDAGTSSGGVDRYGSPRKMKYRKNRAREVAVLVGDFTAADGPAAQKTLEKLRHLQSTTLADNPSNESWSRDRTVKSWRTLQQSFSRSNSSQPLGPMSHAFITSNPRVPEEYFKPKGVDKMVIDMNKPLPHSLLKCSGKYTVRVATFATPVIPYVANDKQKEAQAAKAVVGSLEEAADKAHRLTEALRAKGYDAYEFHDRYSSIVTIGSFDNVGTPRADGKTEINPQIHKIMETFGADKEMKPGQPGVLSRVGQPKRMESVGINFDIQPMPVEVPKHTISADYNQRS